MRENLNLPLTSVKHSFVRLTETVIRFAPMMYGVTMPTSPDLKVETEHLGLLLWAPADDVALVTTDCHVRYPRNEDVLPSEWALRNGVFRYADVSRLRAVSEHASYSGVSGLFTHKSISMAGFIYQYADEEIDDMQLPTAIALRPMPNKTPRRTR